MFFLPPWAILASLGGLASNTFHFLSRYVLKDKDDPVVYVWYYEALKLIIFASLATIDWKLVLTPQSIVIFIFLGLTESFAGYWSMKMHAYSQLSISTIISRTRLIWVPILAYLFFGEILKPYEYLGIVIIFGGISLVVAPNKFFMDKGAIYANLAAFMVALNLVLLKMALPYGSASVLNAIMCIPIALSFPFLFKNVRKNLRIVSQQHFGLKSFAIIVNLLSNYLTTWALAVGEASKVIALYQSMMIFSVIAGIVFLKERENIVKKLIGTSITLLGILLLTSL